MKYRNRVTPATHTRSLAERQVTRLPPAHSADSNAAADVSLRAVSLLRLRLRYVARPVLRLPTSLLLIIFDRESSSRRAGLACLPGGFRRIRQAREVRDLSPRSRI